MFLYLEALFIGLYVLIIYIIIKLLSIPFPFFIELFIIGFIKHFIGYYGGLQNFYCKYKYNVNINYNNIIYQCILEGLAFILLGYIIKTIFINKYLIYFILGFLIHIISEIVGIHYLFCNYNIIK